MNAISINYTDQQLRILVEEFITMQRSEFTFKGLYSYIVYWGMEDNRIVGDQLTEVDKERLNNILDRIVKDGRIRMVFAEETKYIKQ